MSASESTETNPTPSTTAPAAATAAANPAPASAPEAAAKAETPAPAPDALAAAKKEAADNYERYLRAVADLENFRKRTVRDKEELRQFAAARVLEDLLPVIDTLGLGIAAAKQPNADLKSLTGGVEMVLVQLKTVLSNHGLKEINPAGQVFDANQHESLSAQPSADVPEGNVLTVVRPGFSLNGRLLRPASVVLSSGAPKPEEAAKG
jgi:molecular chaperone GrpE